MFLCEKCLDNYSGPAVGTAKFFLIDCGRGSYGPCEDCKKYGMCADVPSSVLRRKEKNVSS